MTFDFHEEALAEYEEAGRWYEEHRHRLGVEFTQTIEPASDCSICGRNAPLAGHKNARAIPLSVNSAKVQPTGARVHETTVNPTQQRTVAACVQSRMLRRSRWSAI